MGQKVSGIPTPGVMEWFTAPNTQAEWEFWGKQWDMAFFFHAGATWLGRCWGTPCPPAHPCLQRNDAETHGVFRAGRFPGLNHFISEGNEGGCGAPRWGRLWQLPPVTSFPRGTNTVLVLCGCLCECCSTNCTVGSVIWEFPSSTGLLQASI